MINQPVASAGGSPYRVLGFALPTDSRCRAANMNMMKLTSAEHVFTDLPYRAVPLKFRPPPVVGQSSSLVREHRPIIGPR